MTTETYTINATNGKATILKDPDAVLDYSLDWSDWLGPTDTVTTLTMVLDDTVTVDPLVIVSKAIHYTPAVAGIPAVIADPTADPPVAGVDAIPAVPASTITTAFVSGGEVGTTQELTFRIMTTEGRTDDRSVFLKIKDR